MSHLNVLIKCKAERICKMPHREALAPPWLVVSLVTDDDREFAVAAFLAIFQGQIIGRDTALMLQRSLDRCLC